MIKVKKKPKFSLSIERGCNLGRHTWFKVEHGFVTSMTYFIVCFSRETTTEEVQAAETTETKTKEVKEVEKTEEKATEEEVNFWFLRTKDRERIGIFLFSSYENYIPHQ